jgi:glycosyltransferase involved in cell wall biosynthesis
MRIIYLHQYFFTPRSPGGARSYEIASRLVRWGHEVEMVTSNITPEAGGGKEWTRTNEAGISTHWCNVPYANTMGFAARLKAFFDFAVRSYFYGRRLSGDVVYATSTPLTIALPAVGIARALKIPMVLEIRDLWPHIPIAMGILRSRSAIAAAQWLEGFAYRNAARIVALSPGMKAGIERRGYPSDRIHLVPNGCDVATFDVDPERGRSFRRSFDWLGDRPLVVYAGTLGTVNGVGYMIEMAKAVREIDGEVRFLIVGKGAEEGAIRAKAERYGLLGSTVRMQGEVPKIHMPDILSAATMSTSFVIDNAALWDNSANKFFDALAAARPIAVNHEGWIADLIREHDMGIVLPVRDIPRAAQMLVRAVRDREWLQRAGQSAGLVARKSFDRDAQAREVCRVLETVVREARTGAVSCPDEQGEHEAAGRTVEPENALQRER